MMNGDGSLQGNVTGTVLVDWMMRHLKVSRAECILVGNLVRVPVPVLVHVLSGQDVSQPRARAGYAKDLRAAEPSQRAAALPRLEGILLRRSRHRRAAQVIQKGTQTGIPTLADTGTCSGTCIGIGTGTCSRRCLSHALAAQQEGHEGQNIAFVDRGVRRTPLSRFLSPSPLSRCRSYVSGAERCAG